MSCRSSVGASERWETRSTLGASRFSHASKSSAVIKPTTSARGSCEKPNAPDARRPFVAVAEDSGTSYRGKNAISDFAGSEVEREPGFNMRAEKPITALRREFRRAIQSSSASLIINKASATTRRRSERSESGLHPFRRWKLEGLLEPHDLLRAVCGGDGDARETLRAFVDDDLRRMIDEVIGAVERHVQEIVLRIVSDPDHRDPLGQDLIADIGRRHFNFSPLAEQQRFRHAIEELSPLGLWHGAHGCHDVLSVSSYLPMISRKDARPGLSRAS